MFKTRRGVFLDRGSGRFYVVYALTLLYSEENIREHTQLRTFNSIFNIITRIRFLSFTS